MSEASAEFLLTHGPLASMTHAGWIPKIDQLSEWVKAVLAELEQDGGQDITHPVVRDFQDVIEKNPELFMGFNKLFDIESPINPGNPPLVHDYKAMLKCFDKFLGEAPKFNPDVSVLLPFTSILFEPACAPNGFTILSNHEVNVWFRKIFAKWSEFLASRESTSVLTEDDGGWLGTKAMQQMPGFVNLFECDTSQPHWGFTSWNHFFSRKLRAGARPVECPTDSSVITSACESDLLRQEYQVKETDKFWIKGLPYSLTHMLLNDNLAARFAGGTVHQAFLTAFYYHRWHSPVDGTIHKIRLIEGTYFARIPDAEPPSVAKPRPTQQAFFAHIATRMLIYIEADDPRIGLMCFVGIGMVEVSSCQAPVHVGQRVKKGQEIGTFNFGGSTHCLVFRPEVKLEFLKTKPNEHVNVRSAIARVVE